MNAIEKTFVRIENGVTQFITASEAREEIEAGQMGPRRRRLIRQMYGSGLNYTIDYYDGRKVTIRPAREDEKPATPKEKNLQTHTGTVHAPGRYSRLLRGNRPACCSSESAVSRYHYLVTVDSPVTCKRCLASLQA